LADRFNILFDLQTATPVALDAQVIINAYAGGSCNGGNPGGVYEYAFENGIPDGSCMNYIAKNLEEEIAPIDVCRDCTWPPPPEGESGIEGCTAVEPNRLYYVSNYYSLSGADKMKAEIYQNGPIGCGIDATDSFDAYTGGIYSEVKDLPVINHEVSIVGYGVTEEGLEYWIGRNSWGTYWGEYGFFRIQMHSNNLAIEDDCIAATPSVEKFNPDDIDFPTEII